MVGVRVDVHNTQCSCNASDLHGLHLQRQTRQHGRAERRGTVHLQRRSKLTRMILTLRHSIARLSRPNNSPSVSETAVREIHPDVRHNVKFSLLVEINPFQTLNLQYPEPNARDPEEIQERSQQPPTQLHHHLQ